MTENTLILIKPDAYKANVCGQIITDFELNGFKIVNSWCGQISTEFATEHYEEHVEKPFFKYLMKGITDGKLIAFVMEKENAIKDARELIGETNPKDSKMGTLRRKFGVDLDNNAVHGSANSEDAAKEIKLWFPCFK